MAKISGLAIRDENTGRLKRVRAQTSLVNSFSLPIPETFTFGKVKALSEEQKKSNL